MHPTSSFLLNKLGGVIIIAFGSLGLALSTPPLIPAPRLLTFDNLSSPPFIPAPPFISDLRVGGFSPEKYKKW